MDRFPCGNHPLKGIYGILTITQAQWLSTKTENSPTPQVITIQAPKYFYEHKNMVQEMSLRTALSWDKDSFWRMQHKERSEGQVELTRRYKEWGLGHGAG